MHKNRLEQKFKQIQQKPVPLFSEDHLIVPSAEFNSEDATDGAILLTSAVPHINLGFDDKS